MLPGRGAAGHAQPQLTASSAHPSRPQLGILLRGMEGIRLLEKYSAPVLIALTTALLLWAVGAAGGLGPMLSTPSRFATWQELAPVFLSCLSPQIGYW